MTANLTTLSPRITDSGFEVATGTLRHKHGRKITVVSLPIAAPDEFWEEIRNRNYDAPVHFDYQHDVLLGLRGRRRRLMSSVLESARAFLGTGGFLLSDEGISKPRHWNVIPGEHKLSAPALVPLFILAGVAKVLSFVEGKDDVRSMYLRSFVSSKPKKRQSTKTLKLDLATRSTEVAEYLSRLPDDGTFVTGADKANRVLAWLEERGYTLENIDYDVAVPRDEFGTKYDEDLAADRKKR